MEPTLQAALEAVFRGAPLGEASKVGSETGQHAGELQSARDALEAAQRALLKGDWVAFGNAMQRLSETLGGSSTPGDGS